MTLATPISCGGHPPTHRLTGARTPRPLIATVGPGEGRRRGLRAPLSGLIIVFLSTFGLARAQQTNWAAQARQAFEEHQSEYKSKPDDPKLAWQFARSCFDLADFASDKHQRATLAQQGIDACRKALALDSNAAPAHYFLALNEGQLARTRSLGALHLVTQMEKELSVAIALDPHFDYAGPDRTLGLLYRDAPTFGSIGSRSKARQHLERAVELAPDFPDNRLALLESHLKWGEPENASHQLKALKDAWLRARAELTGANWQASWADWESRLQKAQKRLDAIAKVVD